MQLLFANERDGTDQEADVADVLQINVREARHESPRMDRWYNVDAEA